MASKFSHTSFTTQCYRIAIRPSHNNSHKKKIQKHFFPESHQIVPKCKVLIFSSEHKRVKTIVALMPLLPTLQN